VVREVPFHGTAFAAVLVATAAGLASESAFAFLLTLIALAMLRMFSAKFGGQFVLGVFFRCLNCRCLPDFCGGGTLQFVSELLVWAVFGALIAVVSTGGKEWSWVVGGVVGAGVGAIVARLFRVQRNQCCTGRTWYGEPTSVVDPDGGIKNWNIEAMRSEAERLLDEAVKQNQQDNNGVPLLTQYKKGMATTASGGPFKGSWGSNPKLNDSWKRTMPKNFIFFDEVMHKLRLTLLEGMSGDLDVDMIR
jgi:hypothetical protein